MGYAKSEDTKRKLLSTTSRLLWSQGYAATGISQVLAESGVPKGSLYHHFPDGKSELATAAVDFSNSFIADQLEALVAASADAASAFEAFCDFYSQSLIQTNFEKGCPIATITLEAASEVPAIQQRCDEGFEMIENIFRRELVAEGADPRYAADVVTMALSAVEGALILCRAKQGIQPIMSIRDSVAQQIRNATADSAIEDGTNA